MKKYGSVLSDETVPVAFNVIARRMEATGYLLHRKLVDIDLVLDLFAVGILWEKFKPLAEGLREQLNEPQAYGWFEYLYNEMKKREQKLATIQENTLPSFFCQGKC